MARTRNGHVTCSAHAMAKVWHSHPRTKAVCMTESLPMAADIAAQKADLTLGVEEELHVVDLVTRELVPRAPEILADLDGDSYSAELHRSVVETNTPVATTLDGLRDGIVSLRRVAIQTAERKGLGL